MGAYCQYGCMAQCRRNGAHIQLADCGSEWKVSLYSGLPAGSYCNVIASDDSSTCQAVVVGSDGRVTITVPPMKAVAMHVNAMKKV